jgi:hypothetical protein
MNSTARTFVTDDLPLAAFIAAKQALRLASVTTKGEYGRFHFYDPEGKGESLAFEMASGGQVSAIAFQQAIKILKRQVIALVKQQTAQKLHVEVR